MVETPGTTAPAAVPRLEFANLRLLVRDFARSWDFCREMLGLMPGVGDAQGPYAEFLWGAEARLGPFDRRLMGEAVGGPAQFQEPSGLGPFALVFPTQNVDVLYDHLRSNAVPFVAPRRTVPMGGCGRPISRAPTGIWWSSAPSSRFPPATRVLGSSRFD